MQKTRVQEISYSSRLKVAGSIERGVVVVVVVVKQNDICRRGGGLLQFRSDRVCACVHRTIVLLASWIAITEVVGKRKYIHTHMRAKRRNRYAKI